MPIAERACEPPISFPKTSEKQSDAWARESARVGLLVVVRTWWCGGRALWRSLTDSVEYKVLLDETIGAVHDAEELHHFDYLLEVAAQLGLWQR